MTGADEARLAAAFRDACLAELAALKPGNVHVHAPGHRMTVADFERSAEVSAPLVARRGARVGARVRAAVEATLAAVGQNTNLGIVLLCAPILAAAERGGEPAAAMRTVLDGLTAEDAEDVFAAIRLANPGGLGTAPEHDVRGAATDLAAAMRAAAARDTIALQYADGFAEIRSIGLPALERAVARHGDGPQAATELYLAWLAAFPDSHVARKHGLATALEVQATARALIATSSAGPATKSLVALDKTWKRRSINPGTSADLTVATILSRNISDFT